MAKRSNAKKPKSKSAPKGKQVAKKSDARLAGAPPHALPSTLRGRDYISTQDFTMAEIDLLLDTAARLKAAQKAGVAHRYLQDKTLFMMFFDKSTRTRNSMEAGMTQLGGHAHYVR